MPCDSDTVTDRHETLKRQPGAACPAFYARSTMCSMRDGFIFGVTVEGLGLVVHIPSGCVAKKNIPVTVTVTGE